MIKEKYEVMVGKINKQGVGDYHTIYTCNNLEEGKEKFYSTIVEEKRDLKAWNLNSYQHLEILLQLVEYDEYEEETLDVEVLECEEIGAF